MSDFFKSALGNISSSWASSSTENDHNGPSTDNAFVGQTVDLKGQRLRVDRVIAEGGFGFVFKVRDLDTQEVFALKRLIAADKDAKDEIDNEIQVLIKLQPHPHVMKFVSWGLINQNIYLLLSEFCGCGSLQDIQLPISNLAQLNRISYQLSLAIQQMHKLALIHRDLKIENILFDYNGFVKLCDFGSATSKFYEPDHNWTPIQRSLVEDEMSRHTTPMYRPPEILDTYLHYPINTAMDIWAFGCLLFTIKFGRHPFEDSAKLRIINCKYTVPAGAPEDIQLSIIRSCLNVDPRERPSIDIILETLETNYVDLTTPCVTPKQPTPTHVALPDRVSPVPPQNSAPGSAQPGGQGFGFGGFIRNLKDQSTKIIQNIPIRPAQQGRSAENKVPDARPSRPPPPPQKSTEAKPQRPAPPSTALAPEVKPSRPPPPRPQPPPVEPKAFLGGLDWQSEDHGDARESSEKHTPRVAVVNDLLNLSLDDSAAPKEHITRALDPLLGGSDTDDSAPEQGDDTVADLLGGGLQNTAAPSVPKTNTNMDILNDIFSSASNVKGELPQPTKASTIPIPHLFPSPSAPNSVPNSVAGSLHRNTSTPNLTQTDPFTQLGSFIQSTSNNTTAPAKTQPPLQPIQTGLPRVASYSGFQNSSAPKAPVYSSSLFNDINAPPPNPTGAGPKVLPNQFEDLLSGFPKKISVDTSNMSMAQLKKVEMIRDGVDPVKLKIMEWKENKTRNIRALLGSLDVIVWEDCKWQAVGMHQLVDPGDVKKMYRKACLAVHPDKLVGTEHEELAKLIFVELNDAWAEFEKSN